MGAIAKYKIDYLFLAKLQDEPEKNPFLFSTENYFPINPISNLSTKDVWHYIAKYNLPYCSLYKKECTKLACQPCSVKIQKKKEHVRGESVDTEVVKKLKALGYV